MNDQVVFRNPNIRFRKEIFGGIVVIDGSTLIIDSEIYKALDNFTNHLTYDETKSKIEQSILQQMIEKRFLLVIPKDDAEKILEGKEVKYEENRLRNIGC